MMLAIGPGRPEAGDVVQEVPQHRLAVLGVQHLGVELDAGEAAVDVLERRDRGAGRRGGHGEPVGAAVTASPWLIQHLLRGRQAVQQRAGIDAPSASVRPNSDAAGVRDLAAQRLRPWPGSRSRCRSTGTPASNSAGSVRGAPSAYTDWPGRRRG